ncbi:MAG: ferritin-like domain-containing protein [Deltaproteobacteria bacterium]|nr:ferritin-like domain-containing protein [Deltaproteobacteria bacterium]
MCQSVETLRTSLDLTYVWDYREDGGVRELYARAKGAQWDGVRDLPWELSVDPEGDAFPDMSVPIWGSELWDRLSVKERRHVKHEATAWTISQFLHGEQGALLAASQLVEAAGTMDAKMYAATQAVDEARHVEVYERYLREKMQRSWPVADPLKSLLDQVLVDRRWDMKYLGMQIMVEGLALAAFGLMRATTEEPLLRALTTLVMRDEARHVAFGAISLRDVYRDMSEGELREREDFVVEASRLMRDRFLGTEVWASLGLPVAECTKYTLQSPVMSQFRVLLFSRIVPNLKRLGLLTPRVRPSLETIGVLEFEHLDPDADPGELLGALAPAA